MHRLENKNMWTYVYKIRAFGKIHIEEKGKWIRKKTYKDKKDTEQMKNVTPYTTWNKNERYSVNCVKTKTNGPGSHIGNTYTCEEESNGELQM